MSRRALLVGLVVLCTIAVPLTGGAVAAGADTLALQEDDGGMDDGMDGNDSMGDDSMDGNDSMDSEGGMDGDDGMDGDSGMSDGDGMDENSMNDADDSGDDSLPLTAIGALAVGGIVVLGGVGLYVTRE